MFRRLVKQDLLKPLPPSSQPNNLPPNHRTDLYCEYHQSTGHTTLTCHRLAHKIQDLIESKAIPPPPKPNTTSNPLPQHQNNHIGSLTLSSTKSPCSTIFDPSQYIIPISEPKPFVPITQNVFVLALEHTPYPNLTDHSESSLHVTNLLEDPIADLSLGQLMGEVDQPAVFNPEMHLLETAPLQQAFDEWQIHHAPRIEYFMSQQFPEPRPEEPEEIEEEEEEEEGMLDMPDLEWVPWNLPQNDPIEMENLPVVPPPDEPIIDDGGLWDPAPNPVQLYPLDDPLDEWSLPFLFEVRLDEGPSEPRNMNGLLAMSTIESLYGNLLYDHFEDCPQMS